MKFELVGSARSIIQFEGVLPEAAPCVAYTPVDLDRQVRTVVDVAPELYELVRFVVHQINSLYVEHGNRLCQSSHPVR